MSDLQASAYEKLETLVKKGDVEIYFIDGLQRTLSTVLEVSLTQLADGQEHEPFHNASQEKFQKDGYFAYDFQGGCSKILARAEQLLTEHPHRPVKLVVKELAKYLPAEDYKQFLPLTKNAIFIDREPHLQSYSLLRLRAEAAKSGKLSPDEVLSSNSTIAESAMAYDSSSREAMQQHFALLGEYRKRHPDYRVAFASGLSFMADTRKALEQVADKIGLLEGLDSHNRSTAIDKLEKDWSKATGKDFHGLYPGASIGGDGVTDSAWIGQAVRSTGFQALGKKEDVPHSLDKFPSIIQEHLMQYGLPNYLDALVHPDNVTRLNPTQLNSMRFGSEKKLFEDINPVEAYALCATSDRNVDALDIMQRIRKKYPEHATALLAIDEYAAQKFGERENIPEPLTGLHYSGYNHRPYDYSTKRPDELDAAFKQSRFAHSLTNLHPRHYSAQEKDRLFTLKFAQHALAAGDISAPKDRTVLWSGGYVPGHPLGYGLGRIIAERWLVEKNREIERSGKEYHEIKNQLYHTVAMTEAGLPVLNPMWDDRTVPEETKWKVTPTYIIGFAKTARGEITLNVDDTDIDSFFRQNEIDVVMKNPDITTVRVVRVDAHTDKLIETVYPDRQSWYEDQKDQWVDSIITRYNLALETANHATSGQKLEQRMSGALVEEIYDSYKNITQGNPLLEFKDDDDRKASLERERTRLKRFVPVISQHPELLDHEKISSEPARTAIKQLFSKILHDQSHPSATGVRRTS